MWHADTAKNGTAYKQTRMIPYVRWLRIDADTDISM